jgi:MFS family permease
MNLVQDPSDPRYDYTGTIIGAANGTFFGAGFIGCLLAAWMVDALGRVSTFRIAAIVGVIGGAVQGGAVNPGMVSHTSSDFAIWKHHLLNRIFCSTWLAGS